MCELAKGLLEQCASQIGTLQEINVKQERQYYHEYGARIPVLKNTSTGDELGWPFTLEELKEFLG